MHFKEEKDLERMRFVKDAKVSRETGKHLGNIEIFSVSNNNNNDF